MKTLLLFALLVAPLARAAVIATNIDAGVVSSGMTGSMLHSNSTLHRKWVVLNDDTCPVQLNVTNAATDEIEGRRFSKLKGSFSVSKPAQAYSVTYVLFDWFDQETKTVNVPIANDWEPGNQYPLPWTQDEDRFLTCAIFVRSVRPKDGDAWSCDESAVNREIEKLHLKRSAR